MSPLVKYLLRNLSSRPFVTALVIGSMIVVGTTIAGVTATAAGLRKAFGTRGHDNWAMVVATGAHTEKDSSLDPTWLNMISTQPDIKRISPEVVTATMVAQSGSMDVVLLRGLEPIGFDMHQVVVTEGRMPEHAKPEIIVGDTLRKHLPWLKLGAHIKLVDMDLTVVGYFRASGFFSGEAWTTRAVFQADPARKSLGVVYLEAASPAAATTIATNLKGIKAIRVDASTEADFYEKMIGEYKHLAIGLLMVFLLVVGGAVLTAASVLALLQQRRLPELCMMRAMGFRDRRISALIIYETQLAVMVGGGIGITIAAIALRNFVMHAVSGSISSINFEASLSWDVAAQTIGLMFAIGFAGAIVPIIRMKRTGITVGLREE
jgi:ABC-type lipoprotein release transport system permease subunit